MSGPSAVRRRRGAVAAAALAALAAGVAAGAGREEEQGAGGGRVRPAVGDPEDEAAVRAMPLDRQAGALVVLRFRGAPPSAEVERALRRGLATGVILFADNVTTKAALRRTTVRLQRAAGATPALIAVDQEGGSVRRIPFAAPAPGQAALGTPGAAAEAARAAARDLARLGINVNLAPVADVAAGPRSVVAQRAFPGGTAAAARLTRAAVAAYRGSGVLATLKHFPGLGAATANTDDRPVTIRRSARSLGTRDLPAFRAGIAAGAPLVMTSHALYPALDPARIASQSPAVHRLLRDTLGFRGLVVTDSLEAEAVRRRGGHEAGAVRAVRAGADLLLTTRRGSFRDVLDALMAESRRSRSFHERLIRSAARVLAVRRALARRAAG